MAVASAAFGAERLDPIAVRGTPAPGSGNGNFGVTFSLPAINDHGQVTFHGSVSGTGSFTGVWMGTGPGDLSLLVRSGQQAPGHAAGTTFGDFNGTSDYALQPLNNGKAVIVASTGTTRTPYVLTPGAAP
jgi:hypothetical protein